MGGERWAAVGVNEWAQSAISRGHQLASYLPLAVPRLNLGRYLWWAAPLATVTLAAG